MADTEKLQNLGQEAAAGLAQTLSALIGRDVTVNLAEVSSAEATAVAATLDSPCLLTTLKGSGGIDGAAFLLAKEKDSSIIADLLIGQDGSNAPAKMTELHLSAFGEVIQQMTEVFTREVKKLAGPKAQWEVAETVALAPSAAGVRLSKAGGVLMVFNFGLSVPDLISGEMFFYLPEPVASRITSGAGKPAASMTAGHVQSGVSVENTQSRAGGAVVQQLENEFSGSARPTGGNIGLLMDVPLKLTVELGRTTKLVKEILALAPGSVVELDKLAGEPVDILVNEKLIAKGEVVVIDENFGVRITEIINPEERLHAVQA